MAWTGIYATPNRVVANKNREKTIFNLLNRDIKKFKNLEDCLKLTLEKWLRIYYTELNINYYDDWEILSFESSEDGIDLVIKDRFGDENNHFIPKDWFNNHDKFMRERNQNLLKNKITELNNEINFEQKIINDSTNKIKVLKEELENISKNE